MEENNTTNPNEKNESKKQKKQQPKKNAKPSFSETVADYKAEFKKIVWPTRQDLAKKNSNRYPYFLAGGCDYHLHGFCVFRRI